MGRFTRSESETIYHQGAITKIADGSKSCHNVRFRDGDWKRKRRPSWRWSHFHWEWAEWTISDMRTSEGQLRFGDKVRGKAEIVWTCAERGWWIYLTKDSNRELPAGEKEEDLMIMDVVKNDTQRIVVKKEHAGSFMWLLKKINTAYIGAVFKKIKHLLIQMGLKTQCENMSLWSVHFVSMHAMIWVTG